MAPGVKMRVLVTDGDSRAALAVTRSLGRAGHEVFVGEKQTPSLAQMSRYCAGRFRYPDPVTASDAFVAALARFASERRVDVLMPVTDITTLLVTGHRDRFPESCAIPFAPAAVIERAANKVDIVETAQRLGVAVPKSVVVADAHSVPESGVEFPVVIKPRQSRVRTPREWRSTGVSYAADHEQLRGDLASRGAHEFPVMLQERIVGPGVGVFACYHHGKPVALFSHRRLRERPPWGGVSVFSESVELCPVARDYAIRLLDDLGWHGVAMVEFKRDVRDNVPKLMEINGRFWGSLQLAVDAGVDFPALLLESANGGHFDPQPPYKVGVRSRWLWGDVDSLLVTLFGAGMAPPDHRPSRVGAVLDFLTFWGRDLHYENPRASDLRPWVYETYGWLQRGVMGARSQRRSESGAVGEAAPLKSPAVARSRGTRIVPSLEETGLDEHSWNALASQSDTNSVFQTHEFIRSWWKTFGQCYEPLFVTVDGPAGVRGVAPFVVEQGLSRERVVRFIGDGRADYCDVLTAGGKPDVVADMFRAIRDYGDWDVIELNNLPAASRTVAILSELSDRAGYQVITDDHFVCPTLLIEGHELEAAQVLNKGSLRRRQNYFERTGRLVCRNLTRAADVEAYLDRFFQQHIGRWRDTKSPSLFLNARNQQLYRELTSPTAGKGWLLFSVIEFNDEPIAFHYGFDYNGSVIWYKPSFNVAFASRSPGLVLVRHLVGYALDRKRKELDFTVGDELFKKRFTNGVRKTVRMQIFQRHGRFMLEQSKRRVLAAVKSVYSRS
jgi:predicted ATP-grasp superfamily ATP-dependent carboligase/CelD/BcsL family acetyltransferase involved in cellulose biosynthesis